MATTLQQLLDGLTEQASTATTSTSIEDVTGALAHLGRALAGLTHDGLTPADSPRQRAAALLGAACSTAGRLWPPTGGPLTDLAGAAADLIGRDRLIMGRSHRWAVTVAVAEAADHCAALARRLLPQAAVAELGAVRRLAATVERDALTDPPTPAAAALLDRLVPMPAPEGGASVPDAAAALVTALDRACREDDLTLRQFRAIIATAMVGSRYALAVTAAAAGEGSRRWETTAAAWQLAGRASMAFDDGRRTRPADPRGAVGWARALVDALRADLGPQPDPSALRCRDTPAHKVSGLQRLANQLPILADQLATVVQRWSRTGQLYAYARDLPPMDDMPEQRVRAVIAGHRVQARGADLERLRRAVHRAGALSAALADILNRAAPAAAAVQRHLAGHYAEQVRRSSGPERLLSQVQAVERALAAGGITPMAGHRHTPHPGPPAR
ncbi:hypothetical protein [Blastococcus sp. PRF04-17]|uniref:hypothetical protein n=1 Tax=Blastococcus sp. PRF04-17 TaxID=2933797 RepID=UPI001FF50262|nr:hypothetical protein [Blastococcus sp. PRF04-17]UOY00002.1 hypothetical protein MVA48_13330 [Blastococcus sp. PRF04-17]